MKRIQAKLLLLIIFCLWYGFSFHTTLMRGSCKVCLFVQVSIITKIHMKVATELYCVQNSFVAVVSVRLIFPTRAKYFPKNCLGFNWKINVKSFACVGTRVVCPRVCVLCTGVVFFYCLGIHSLFLLECMCNTYT